MDARIGLFLLSFLCNAAWATDPGMHLECKIVVPQRFLEDTIPPPNGEPERIRYAHAYEAFWWNCVAVKANDMDAQCPIEASGTPGASDGGGDGAIAALNGITDLVRKYGPAQVQAYLRELASPASMVQSKLHGYFGGKPKAESRDPA